MFGIVRSCRTMLALLLCCLAILAGFLGCAAPPAAQLSMSIKLEATSSTWREGEEPYGIYSATKKNLERAGFEVVSGESDSYDATLLVDYKETEGFKYSPGGTGTSIRCNLILRDKTDNSLFEKEIFTGTSPWVESGRSLYEDAVKNFENEPYFKYLGEIIATKFGVSDEVSVLISALKDRDSGTRCKAAAALEEKRLGEIGDTRAVEPLIQVLKDKDKDVRLTAARVLGGIGDARAVEPLIQALTDEERVVRMNAATALGRIGDKRAIEPLTDALEDEWSFAQKAAREALEKIQGK